VSLVRLDATRDRFWYLREAHIPGNLLGLPDVGDEMVYCHTSAPKLR